MVIENLSWRKGSMLGKPLLELITTTGEILELEDLVIEKDYFVAQVINALSKVENDYFRLVFCGGTCLAKAHKVIYRMSEDIDFKIQIKEIGEHLSKTRLLKELKIFRSLIQSKLTHLDLSIGNTVVRNEGQYSRIELDYPSVFPFNTRLRPHILLEFTLSNIRLATSSLPIKTLIEETLENIILFSPSFTHCISVNETAIEKWVGLTRRVVAIERNYHSDDETLIRHVYDLNAIKQASKIDENFFTLAKTIVSNDAKQFKNQHPEYAENPSEEIKQSLSLLKNKSIWKARYQEFIETMVYDNINTIDYESAVANIEHISTKIMGFLSE